MPMSQSNLGMKGCATCSAAMIYLIILVVHMALVCFYRKTVSLNMNIFNFIIIVRTQTSYLSKNSN